MTELLLNILVGYWTPQEIAANIVVILNILGALLLGLLVGYERSYHGRAAGMRTYGLVCMAACALTAISGYPEFWYGSHTALNSNDIGVGRVVQGIIAGIGFLGAGVIMRDGMNISGLTTAASIWTVATIGIIVGVGFYSAAITMAVVSTIFMMWGSKIENLLPARHAVAIKIHFSREATFTEESISKLVHMQGYEVAHGSFTIDQHDGVPSWRFIAISLGKGKSSNLVQLSEIFRQADGIQDFHVSHARN